MDLNDFGVIWRENVMMKEISRGEGGGLAEMREQFHLLEKKKILTYFSSPNGIAT